MEHHCFQVGEGSNRDFIIVSRGWLFNDDGYEIYGGDGSLLLDSRVWSRVRHLYHFPSTRSVPFGISHFEIACRR